MRKPDAILFDLWGTLINSVDFDPRKGHAAVLESCENPNRVTLDEVMDLGQRVVSATVAREEEVALEFTQASLLRIVSDAFGLRPRKSLEESELIFWKASLQVSMVDGVSDLLREIAASGMPMGVVSNSSFAGPTLEQELEVQGIRRYFRFVISSADYGVRKPDPIIFEVALRRLGMEPGQVWFAGDNVGYDIIGARRSGIFPVAFNPRKGIPDEAGEHAVITSWAQLLPLLASASPA
jgi:haloacid dehalogenase superfamily, subfamily IA, variant 1 with third motif having Dx(3-4)D or Dx(3-4)E